MICCFSNSFCAFFNVSELNSISNLHFNASWVSSSNLSIPSSPVILTLNLYGRNCIPRYPRYSQTLVSASLIDSINGFNLSFVSACIYVAPVALRSIHSQPIVYLFVPASRSASCMILSIMVVATRSGFVISILFSCFHSHL